MASAVAAAAAVAFVAASIIRYLCRCSSFRRPSPSRYNFALISPWLALFSTVFAAAQFSVRRLFIALGDANTFLTEKKLFSLLRVWMRERRRNERNIEREEKGIELEKESGKGKGKNWMRNSEDILVNAFASSPWRKWNWFFSFKSSAYVLLTLFLQL